MNFPTHRAAIATLLATSLIGLTGCAQRSSGSVVIPSALLQTLNISVRSITLTPRQAKGVAFATLRWKRSGSQEESWIQTPLAPGGQTLTFLVQKQGKAVRLSICAEGPHGAQSVCSGETLLEQEARTTCSSQAPLAMVPEARQPLLTAGQRQASLSMEDPANEVIFYACLSRKERG